MEGRRAGDASVEKETQQGVGLVGADSQAFSPYRQRRRIILCFDGTGNKFQGNDSDSNILKIYRMLDRNNGDKHYYQPGIGTYINTRSISHTSRIARLNSWYQKTKDSAVGTSFDEHVMGAYKFLMQSYNDDDIFIFGFSRGAYVARFLAEMLDHVGLLSAGNQEMARFAWKAFAQWQQREDITAEEKKKKKEMLDYLMAFRQTFSRPVRRISFLGLFDTVNSVPRFENAWMKRSKFPYTARSTARIIRHAVSIDERRAKFRQDLISENKTRIPPDGDMKLHHGRGARSGVANERFRRRSAIRPQITTRGSGDAGLSVAGGTYLDPSHSNQSRLRSASLGISPKPSSDLDGSSIASVNSYQPGRHLDDEEGDEDEEATQDIEELWFPGCHADLGGGWPLAEGEDSALSLGPLVWMVREAQRAGLEFNCEQMLQLNCCDDDFNIPDIGISASHAPGMPKIEITGSPFTSPRQESEEPGWAAGMEPERPTQSKFHQNLLSAATKGLLHDCLEFKNGLPATSVMSWKIMEYLPFRRMDLQPDGSWKAISMPLPMGEVRDIPDNAWIHHSAIRRMEANENYRPGNLIVGGGGRGLRKAPKEMGLGNWEVLKGKDDPVGMVYTRKESSPSKHKTG